MEIRGERVLLRPIRADELMTVRELREQSEHVMGPRLDDEQLRRRIETSGEWVDGRLELGIEAEGRLLGTMDARAPRNLGVLPPGVCEIGIELTSSARGRGLGTHAIALLTDWLHANGFPRVQASTDVANAPMRRVLEKLGWQHEGTLRAFMPTAEGRADYALYAAIASARARRASPRPTGEAG